MARTAEALNDLIAACRESEESFGMAALSAQNDDLRLRFTAAAHHRAEFADELVGQLQASGGPVHQRSRREREGVAEPKDDPSVLADCESVEDNTLRHYERALTFDLPAVARAVVERQRLAVQETLFELRSLETVRKAG